MALYRSGKSPHTHAQISCYPIFFNIQNLYFLRLVLVIWLVPSLVGNAVAVSLLGLFAGPMYPIMLNRAGRALPASIITGAVGWIAGVGTVGAALFPFVTGALASGFGVQSLQPL